MDEVAVNLQDAPLEGGADGGLDLVGELGLALELRDLGLELPQGEALLALALGRAQAEDREHVGVDDLEVLVGVRLRRPECDVEEPLDRLQPAAIRGGDGLAALELEEGAAGDGVERLEAAVDEDGQAPEALDVERGGVARRPQGAGDPGQDEDEDEIGGGLFHAAAGAVRRRLAMKPSRWIVNCQRRPSVITLQAM